MPRIWGVYSEAKGDWWKWRFPVGKVGHRLNQVPSGVKAKFVLRRFLAGWQEIIRGLRFYSGTVEQSV